MERLLIYIIILAILYFAIKYALKVRSSSTPMPPKGTDATVKPIPLTEQNFEEHWHTGPLPCDGLQCNPSHACSKPERLLCRDVISPCIPAGYFTGQFSLQLKSGNRRIDIAIETPEGKRIAVELDGYKTHASNLKAKDFDYQLQRQNELICSGWTVLRFSFFQVLNHPAQCRDILRSAMQNRDTVFNKNPVLKGICPETACGGQVYRLRSHSGNFFWKCPQCQRTFNADAITPKRAPLSAFSAEARSNAPEEKRPSEKAQEPSTLSA